MRADAARLAELEEERRFLLESLRDLDREREVGDVASADFDALRDGYVARAAAVLREIDGGRSSQPVVPTRNWGRRLAILGLTLAVAVGLGVFVARSAGQRLPGQGLTGGQPADEVAVQLAEGRRLMNLGQFADSQSVYAEVLQLEPDNLEARTYSAWVDVLTANDSLAVQESLAGLIDASTVDATYADPHCLLALAFSNFVAESDPELVRQEAETCLALNPPADIVPLIEGVLAQLAP
ncbi:MAG: hypothetical protein HY826_15260 [Actinobacteria bacterium]|nr:hypothetical protein [Actinomycetota bacterium]